VLAYSSKTGKAGMRVKENEKERKTEEGHSRVGGGCYYLFDSGILRADWIYLDIPAGASARGSMSPLPRLLSPASLFFGVH